MPLRNEFFGVYKLAQIQNVPNTDDYSTRIIENATRNRSMDVQGRSYLQGVADNRILDIGNVSETIDINAPILIGAASDIDGRTLLTDQIERARDRASAVLPVLSSASINIQENSSSVKLQLKSDGRELEYPPFRIISPTIDVDYNITGVPELNAPSRVARNYDFGVQFGPFLALVQTATIEVYADVQSAFFLGLPDSPVTPINLSSDDIEVLGTQYPFLGVSRIGVRGNGTAVVLIPEDSTDGQGGVNNPQDTSVALESERANITIQNRGALCVTTNDFRIGIWDAECGEDGTWEDLFVNSQTGQPLMDLSQAVISSTSFNAQTGLMTVSFNFEAYVLPSS